MELHELPSRRQVSDGWQSWPARRGLAGVRAGREHHLDWRHRPVLSGHREGREHHSGSSERRPVVDDMVSFDPFIARGIRIHGRAEDPIRRTGIVGPGWYVRITPTESWSWNMAREPVGDEWYRTEHRIHDDEPEAS